MIEKTCTIQADAKRTNHQQTSRRDLLLVLFLAGFIFCAGIEDRSIRRADEGRVAQVAQEILESGKWSVGQLNGVIRTQKPPGSSWPVALLTKLRGDHQVSTFDALLPSALAAIMMTVLAFLWFRRTTISVGTTITASTREDSVELMRQQGLLAALLLVLMPAFIGQARAATMDLLVALSVALAFFWYERYRFDGSRISLPLLYAVLALGGAVKGHVPLLIFVIPVFIWLGWERIKARNIQYPETKKTRWMRLHALGLLVFVLLVLAWGLPFISEANLNFDAFKKEGLNRFGDETGHQEPFYFYLGNFPLWTLPAFLFLLPALWYHTQAPDDTNASRRRLYLVWLIGNLIFWSVLSAKQRHYAVPWMLPIALLVGDTVPRILNGAGSPKLLQTTRWLFFLTGFALSTAALYLIANANSLPEPFKPSIYLAMLAVLTVICFNAGGNAIFRKHGQGFFRYWWLGICLLLFIYHRTHERYEDRMESPRDFCEAVRKQLPMDAVLFAYDLDRPHILFYLQRKVEVIRKPRLDRSKFESIDLLRQAEQATLIEEMHRLLRTGHYVFLPGPIVERLDPTLFRVVLEDKAFTKEGRSASLIAGIPVHINKNISE